MYIILYLSSVMVPMGGSTEVFTSQDEYEPEQFNYANVRKATYRGIYLRQLQLFQILLLSTLFQYSSSVLFGEYSSLGLLVP